jgi:hypothetical protein
MGHAAKLVRQPVPGAAPVAPAVAAAVDPVAQQVWDDNTTILHPHFADARDFSDTTQRKWAAGGGGVHVHFDNIAAFRRLVPAYIVIGIPDLAQWIRTAIVDVTFLGHTTTVNRDLVPMLRFAEVAIRLLTLFGPEPDVHRVGGFVPRKIGGSNKLSLHAVGRAVDLNAKENPKIAEQVEWDSRLVPPLFRVIAAVTGTDLLGTTDYDTQRAASEAFESRFSDAWIEQQREKLESDKAASDGSPSDETLKQTYVKQQALVADIDALHVITSKEGGKTRRTVLKGLRKLDRYGFLNLDKEVVASMQAAGFVWGGTWGTSKDYMHFEVGSLGP